MSIKRFVFAVIPVGVLLLGGEALVRLKYFLGPPDHDWRYLVAPWGWPPAPPADPAKQTAHDDDQMVFPWQQPCVNQMVYSSELHREMPRTWDENCLRGDHVTREVRPDEYRVVFLGGSTVEDGWSDSEMMTARFKRRLPPAVQGKRVEVVNAGKANFGSRRIAQYWASTIREFSPNLVLYYEAWNEQEGDLKFTGFNVSARLAQLGAYRVHRALYYRSMLYTYLAERFGFRMRSSNRFWKIDLAGLRRVPELARDVRRAGARFIFVTQVVRFPRVWKGVDTFDYKAVDALLDRLKADSAYRYDVTEISALNQRLAVFYTIELCRENDIPVINILDPIEALGDKGRAGLFTDLGHLTVQGDRVVGELIADRLAASGRF